MVYDIQIGNYKLGLLDSVEIHKSVDLLADTAVVTVPGVVYNQALDIEDKVKIGDAVTIKLGYDDNPVTEFEGFLQRIDTDDSRLTFNCEDGIYLTRKGIPAKEFKQCKVKDIAQYITSQLGLSLNCSFDSDIYFEKFIISPNDTAYNVLQKLQESTGGNIYMKGNELNIHPLYIEKGGNVVYDFSINIESSDLKYRDENDRPYQVTVEAVGLNGKKISVTVGKSGGDKETLNLPYPLTMDAITNKANEALSYKSYTGYEGSITGWLIPFVEPTWSAEIRDKDYEYKNGFYYVISVTTTFSESGGARKVQLGRRLTRKVNG